MKQNVLTEADNATPDTDETPQTQPKEHSQILADKSGQATDGKLVNNLGQWAFGGSKK